MSTDVFGALADPTRRQLLSTIADRPATATELAGGLPISRQAVVKHLGALADAGLLERERSGREVRYRVTPAPLSDAVSWMGARRRAVGRAAGVAPARVRRPLRASSQR